MQVYGKRERSRPGKFTKCCPTTISGFESLRRMDNSPRRNGPQVYSTEVGENEIDYKQRCKYLENQLEKFREQAAKVREVIGHKVRNSLECCVFCCRSGHAAIEFAESYPCKSILFVSLLLFSLYSSRFRIMLKYLRRNLQPILGYKSTVCRNVCFQIVFGDWYESTLRIFWSLHS